MFKEAGKEPKMTGRSRILMVSPTKPLQTMDIGWNQDFWHLMEDTPQRLKAGFVQGQAERIGAGGAG